MNLKKAVLVLMAIFALPVFSFDIEEDASQRILSEMLKDSLGASEVEFTDWDYRPFFSSCRQLREVDFRVTKLVKSETHVHIMEVMDVNCYVSNNYTTDYYVNMVPSKRKSGSVEFGQCDYYDMNGDKMTEDQMSIVMADIRHNYPDANLDWLPWQYDSIDSNGRVSYSYNDLKAKSTTLGLDLETDEVCTIFSGSMFR